MSKSPQEESNSDLLVVEVPEVQLNELEMEMDQLIEDLEVQYQLEFVN
jgi:hypothetical protein